MNRRGFLAAILAAAAAPAIVRAASLMKCVPTTSGIMLFDGAGDYLDGSSLVNGWGKGDFTVEMWVKPTGPGIIADSWKHVAQVQTEGKLIEYVDGVMVPGGSIKQLTGDNFSIEMQRAAPKPTEPSYYTNELDRNPPLKKFGDSSDFFSSPVRATAGGISFNIDRELFMSDVRITKDVARTLENIDQARQSVVQRMNTPDDQKFGHMPVRMSKLGLSRKSWVE